MAPTWSFDFVGELGAEQICWQMLRKGGTHLIVALRPKYVKPHGLAVVRREGTYRVRQGGWVMRTSVLVVSVVSLIFSLAVVAPSAEQIESKEPVDIGSRRELFDDDYLIDALQEAHRILHHPAPRKYLW